MPYINLDGRLTEVTQEQFDLYNLGQGSNPAAGGTVTQLDNTQAILNPNTTNNTPGQQLPVSAQNVATQASPLDQQLAAVNAVQVANGGPDATAASNDPAVQAEITRIQQATGQTPSNFTPQPFGSGPPDTGLLINPPVETPTPAPVEIGNQPQENGLVQLSRPVDVEPAEDPFEQARLDAIANEDASPTEQAVIDAGQDAKLSQEEQGQLREFQSQQRAILAAENVPAEPSGPLPSAKTTTANTVVGAPVANLVAEARKQQTLRNLTQTKAQATDWRVKLRLAPNSTYLYNDPSDPGILSPLSAKTGTDGVIFPYTPAIETAYKANYDQYDLTHSNYRGYFYKNSYVDAINMRCTFTAQDTSEANYLLAVIHFVRSVTKMFYGQDSQRGAPPPLVFLSGLGEYQFNEHPCVVSQFNYTLPPDVDYVRAYSTLDMSTNLLDNRTRTSVSGNPLSYGINRVLNSGLFPGAIPKPKAPSNLEIKQPTYVPTKMEISISLLPMQSRQQVSTQFSLKGFANGNLLKGGFW